jgi:hypothetical protein
MLQFCVPFCSSESIFSWQGFFISWRVFGGHLAWLSTLKHNVPCWSTWHTWYDPNSSSLLEASSCWICVLDCMSFARLIPSQSWEGCTTLLPFIFVKSFESLSTSCLSTSFSWIRSSLECSIVTCSN